MKKVVVLGVAVLAAFYLLNPTAGVFELIPDNLPLIGNLDEAAAVALLLMCLKYFGIDLPELFRRDRAAPKPLDRDDNEPGR